MSTTKTDGRVGKIFLSLYVLIAIIVSVALLYLGIRLVMVGGSPYYFIAGLAVLGLAILLALQRILPPLKTMAS